jgi:hypothetical protein
MFGCSTINGYYQLMKYYQLMLYYQLMSCYQFNSCCRLVLYCHVKTRKLDVLISDRLSSDY